MVEYTKVDVEVADTQLKNLKDGIRNNTGTTLRIRCLLETIYLMNYY